MGQGVLWPCPTYLCSTGPSPLGYTGVHWDIVGQTGLYRSGMVWTDWTRLGLGLQGDMLGHALFVQSREGESEGETSW